MAEDKIPYVTQDLLDAAEKAFPNRCPKLTDTNREIWMAVGKAEVVEWLRRQLKRQLERKIL